MTDLTKITMPLGLLEEADPEAAVGLRSHMLSGQPHAIYTVRGWKPLTLPTLKPDLSSTYRAAPEPLRPMTVPWDALRPQWKWAARDPDGDVYVYTKKPELQSEAWIEVCNFEELPHEILAFDPGTVD